MRDKGATAMLGEFNQLVHGDSIAGMDKLPAGSVDLVFADPPFNIGYEYDVYLDSLDYNQYLDWSRRWIAAVHRVLKPDGTFWLAIGDEHAAELKLESQRLGFHFRSWVVWYYTFGVNCVNKFTRSHAHLFHFVKDPKSFTFRSDDLENRVPSARQLVYNDNRANPKGRLPDDTWILRPQDLPAGFTVDQDTWYIPRVNGTFKERAGFHGCQMPEQLLGRIVRLCSNPGELVLDPFSGSATTLAVAKKLGRRYLGFDLSESYIEQGRKRLEAIREGDALDGSPEPTMSAPETWERKAGGRKPAPGRGKAVGAVEEAGKEPIDAGIREAFQRTHDGYSTDVVLAKPELNEQFVDYCKRLSLPGDARSWNQHLLAMRKRGKSAGLPATTRRVKMDRKDCDDYIFASEIALGVLAGKMEEGKLTLDRVLCDPQLALMFDRLAGMFAPGLDSFKYRWAALTLRKASIDARDSAARLVLPAKLDRRVPLDDLTRFDALEDGPGIYLVEGGKKPFYVGETIKLRHRLRMKFDAPQLRSLWMQETKSKKLYIRIYRPGSSLKDLQAWHNRFIDQYKTPLNWSEPA